MYPVWKMQHLMLCQSKVEVEELGKDGVVCLVWFHLEGMGVWVYGCIYKRGSRGNEGEGVLYVPPLGSFHMYEGGGLWY